MASKNLKLLREKFGKSQGDMAKILNISLGSYCNKENGKADFTDKDMDEIHRVLSTVLTPATIQDLKITDIF